MANCSEEFCINCSHLSGETSSSPHLLRYAVVHCSAILGFGTICNLVAIWCVVTCTRTPPPVKVLLCSMLASTLIMCVIVTPFGIEIFLSRLSCDPTRVSRGVVIALVLLYTILIQMEHWYIAAVAYFRATAVRCPQRHTVRLRVVLVLVVAIAILSVALTMGVVVPLWLRYVSDPWVIIALHILCCFVQTLLPTFFTIGCYCSMIVAVRRNKRRLASSERNTKLCSDVMDQATRAMLAVFISNLVLALPYSIFHVFNHRSFTLYIIIHLIFFLHMVVDPFVFVWFNQYHRQKVADRVLAGLEKMKCLFSSTSTKGSQPSTTNS